MKSETISVVISLIVLVLSSIALFVAFQTRNSNQKEVEALVDKKVKAVIEKMEAKEEKEKSGNVVQANFI